MNKIIHLSITKKDVPIRMDVVQYATEPSITFVLDDYTPASGAVATMYIQKPDGTKIFNACTISANQITYKPTTQSFAALGTNICQLRIIKSGNVAISFLIYADVTKNIIDDSAIESQDEFTALEQALADVGGIDEIDQRSRQNAANIVTINSNISQINTDLSKIDSWERGAIPAGSDLNNFTQMGIYTIASDRVPANAPVNGAGVVETIRTGTSGKVIQWYYTNGGNLFYRLWTTTAWTNWRAVTNTDSGTVSLLNKIEGTNPLFLRIDTPGASTILYGRPRSFMLYDYLNSQTIAEVFDNRLISAYNSAEYNMPNTLTRPSLAQFTRVGADRGFQMASDGSVQCNAAGTIEVTAGLTVGSGLVKGDIIGICAYRKTGTTEDPAQAHYMEAPGTVGSAVITPIFIPVSAGAQIYIKVANLTAARGTVNEGGIRLNCRYVSIT